LNKIKAYGICLYKKEQNRTKVLLCKSVLSKSKWGFLKGVQDNNETNAQTAIREFREECGIEVAQRYLEDLFIQKNETKDIGIYLVNYNNIPKIEKYFSNDDLLSQYLSWENSQVGFFDIRNLPPIKTKQEFLTKEIIKKLTAK
jgi:ADP-ribose pyrophosphatase YjhB (NUDIX family)